MFLFIFYLLHELLQYQRLYFSIKCFSTECNNNIVCSAHNTTLRSSVNVCAQSFLIGLQMPCTILCDECTRGTKISISVYFLYFKIFYIWSVILTCSAIYVMYVSGGNDYFPLFSPKISLFLRECYRNWQTDALPLPFSYFYTDISHFYVTFLSFLYFAGKLFSTEIMSVLCFAGTHFCYRTILHEFFQTHVLTQLFPNIFSNFPELFHKIALEIH